MLIGHIGDKDFLDITPNGLLDDAYWLFMKEYRVVMLQLSAARAAFEMGSITVEELESFISQARVLRGFYRGDNASQ